MPADVLRVRVYSAPWRAMAASLMAVSGFGLMTILVAVVFATDPPVEPPLLVRLIGALAVLPALAAAVLRRAAAGTARVDGTVLRLARGGLRVDVPVVSIVRVAPWRIPLPGAGMTLWLRSGTRLRYGVEAVGDPTPLLQALAGAGGVAAAAAALAHPSIVYAATWPPPRRWPWLRVLAKFAGFGLAPAAILFNAHQYIAYGGTLGQYYLLGLGPYLRTFAVYWLTVVIYLVLYAGAWRGVAEGAVCATAWIAPARARGVRRLAEAALRIAYYGGVPALLALRFWG